MAQDTMKTVIDAELKKRFKKKCVDREVTMSDVTAKLIAAWLDGKIELPEDEDA